MKTYKAAFVGTGMIGAGLAANAALNNFDVTLYDVVDRDKMKSNLTHIMDILVEAEAITQEEADAALADVRYTNDLEDAVRGADFVQECIPERLQLKQDTYRTIQNVTGPDTVIASSTSAIFPSKLQDGAMYPGSIVVGHPYNPSYLLPLIEICGGEGADPTIMAKAKEIYEAMGKVPVICKKEINGFVVNRLSWAALASAKECIQEDICSVEDIDKAIMYGPGMRMAVTGQMLTMSLGVDGGFRKMAEKYGNEPSEYDEIYAEGVDEEIANRPDWQGNTVDDVCKYRDKMFVQLLKLQKLL